MFQVMLGGIDPYLETFKVNIPKMTQITTYNGRNRVVRRVAINPAHPFSRGSVYTNCTLYNYSVI